MRNNTKLSGHGGAIVGIATLMTLAGCGVTTTTTTVRDVGQQAVFSEGPRSPHLRGPELHQGGVLAGANYHISVGPEADGLRAEDNATSGDVIATHSFDVRMVRSIEVDGRAPHDPGVEVGVNLGLTHPNLGAPMAEGVSLSELDDLHYRAGVGVRAPVFFSANHSLGLLVEVDLAFQPYHAEVVRQTDQDINIISQIWLPIGHGGVIETETNLTREDLDVDTLRDLAFVARVRPGLYGAYYPGGRQSGALSVTYGASLQNIATARGVVTQSYECTRTELLSESDPEAQARQCRDKKGEAFPVLKNVWAGSGFAGLHWRTGDLVLSGVVQSHWLFNSDRGYAAPLSGDIEVAWVFD